MTDEAGAPEVALLDIVSRRIARLTATGRQSCGTRLVARRPQDRLRQHTGDGDAVWSLQPSEAQRAWSRRPRRAPTLASATRPVELLPDLDQAPPTDLDVRSEHGRHRLWFTAATDKSASAR